MENINVEQWAWIEGYEDRYMISSFGQVKSFVRDKINGKIMSQTHDKTGYKLICLCSMGKQKTYITHRLVAAAFILNIENKSQINHIDEDKTNNNVTNLEWMTAKENLNYGSRNERVGKSNSKAVRNITTGIEYESMTKAAEASNICKSSVSSCCRGKLKTAGGYQWEYVISETKTDTAVDRNISPLLAYSCQPVEMRY